MPHKVPSWLSPTLVISALSLSAAAVADPITFLAQPPLPSGGIMLLERVGVVQATDGPGPEDANETTMKLTTMVAGAPHRRLNLTAVIDYVWRATDIQTPTGERIERNVSGIGDVTLVLSSCYTSSLLGGRLVSSPFASVKIPTGADDESDRYGRLPQQIQVGTGAVDARAGALASWRQDALEVHGAGAYTLRTEANDYDGGDLLRFDLGAQQCVAPWGRCTGRSPRRIYAALESRLVWQAADRGLLAPGESGGINAFVAPGLRAQLGRHTLEAAIQLPLRQPVEQHIDFVVTGGYRLLVQ